MATSVKNIDYNAVQRAFESYYLSEDHEIAGRGDFIQGSIFSKGHGFGSIIRAVVKAATPLFKKAGRVLKPLAKKTGRYMATKGVEAAADIATNVLSGIPAEEALQDAAEGILENAKFDSIQAINSMKNQLRQSKTKRPLKRKLSKKKPAGVKNKFGKFLAFD